MLWPGVLAASEQVSEIRIEGNSKVETDAILAAIAQSTGTELSAETIKSDIRNINRLGYFSDIRVYKRSSDRGTVLIYRVTEKPAVVEIRFEGLEELKESDFKDIIETREFTIVDESVITTDLKKIEKKYLEKGFFLAAVDYSLEPLNANEMVLIFKISERAKVLVGNVHIKGNQYFSDSEIIAGFASRPFTRIGAFGSGSLFQESMLNRDTGYLNFLYRDNGFAKVKVGQPIAEMHADQKYVELSFFVEEGLQYRLGALKVSGDVGSEYYSAEELYQKMLLKNGDIFRHSRFARDVEMLVEQYGNIGYAYVDVNPKVTFNDDDRTVAIDYHIAKGDKVYFGEIVITGNTKTRDNVIRREFEIADGGLYSGTGLAETKKKIQRLGFFEEVKIIKENDPDTDALVNVKVKVKKANTGQFQMSFGYSPAGARREAWFGQTKYTEKNQSGRGWNASIMARYANDKDYDIELGFTDPRVYDSDWLLGLFAAHRRFNHRYFSSVEIPETQSSLSLRVGRRIFELVHGSLALRHSRIRQLESTFIFDDFRVDGTKNTLTLGLSRRDLNNYLDPSDGLDIRLAQSFSGGPLQGDFQFMESTARLDYYFPLVYSDTYSTYFKFHLGLAKLWKFQSESIPTVERYNLGGFENLRGFPYKSVGPKERRLRSPLGVYSDFNIGGDKQILFQTEYFLPLIPQAGIKALLFVDVGRVYSEEEDLELNDFSKFSKDVGFGFRWSTPIAPFRFEWAYPYLEEEKRFGDINFIFTLGY